MLKKIGMLTASVVLAISFSGCTESIVGSDIDKIKNRQFSIPTFKNTYTNSTFDEVLSNWNDCKNDTGKWEKKDRFGGLHPNRELFEVMFTCDHKNDKDKIMLNWLEVENKFILTIYNIKEN